MVCHRVLLPQKEVNTKTSMEDAAGVPIPHTLWGWGLSREPFKGRAGDQGALLFPVPVAGGKVVLTHEPFPKDSKKKKKWIYER